jgi:hypothetical protein
LVVSHFRPVYAKLQLLRSKKVEAKYTAIFCALLRLYLKSFHTDEFCFMAKIKAERVSGSKVITGNFSQQVWYSGIPKKNGWRQVSDSPQPMNLPEVLQSKTVAMDEIPATEITVNEETIPAETISVEPVKPQLDELRATAKALKVKGWHLMGEDALIKAIEEAKAK